MSKSGESSESKLLSFLIGKVMQATAGRANPQIVREMILERVLKEPDHLHGK